MRCLPEKSTTLASLFFLSGLLVQNSLALDDKRLWLPTKYSTLFFDLKEAALAAEALDRCVTVQRGTIDLDRSASKKPIFRILCRQSDGMTYNEMVDGVTFETLTTKVIVPVEPTAEELEALRVAEEKRKAEVQDARKKELWDACEKEFAKNTRLMKDVALDDEILPPEPEEFSEDKAIFSFPFEAKDIYGANLLYIARCTFNEGDILSLKISGRTKR